MKQRKQELALSYETDPFLNMLIRPNRSPVLKPVVCSRSHMQVSRSAGSLREKFKLPPIVCPRRSTNFQATSDSDRMNLKTPNFKVSTKRSEAQTCITKKTQKPPIPETKKEKKELKASRKDFKNLFVDVSFGDVDENAGGLNEVMKKYKY